MSLHQLPLKDSVATKLLQIIFGIYFVITLIVTLVQMGSEYLYQEETIQSEIQALPKFFETQIANALWTINYEQIRFTLIGMQKTRSVTGVRIEDDQEKNIYAIGHVIDQKGEFVSFDDQGNRLSEETDQKTFSKLTSFKFSITHNDKNGQPHDVGKLILFSNRQVVIDRVEHGFTLIIINSVIKTLALWIIFILCARLILGRPLAILTSTIGKVDLDHLDNIKVDIHASNRNEFKILEEAFNSMIEKLHHDAEKIKKILMENANLSANLEEKVQQRTLELKEAQSQLVQSEKMASLGVLTAGVAHEINNPTNFIHSGAQNLEKRFVQLKDFIFQLAEEDSQEEMQRVFEPKLNPIFQNLEAILNGSIRIQEIVKGLRTFSRLDEANLKKADIVEGIKSTLVLVRSKYRDQVEFICEFAPVPMIECWPAQLNQVFMNIMVNGCQAILANQNQKRMKGTLTIRVFSQNSSLVISFQDTGCGIPKDIQDKIFDPFFTTKTIGEGTGLGLHISSGIIANHQGKITVESKGEEGTTFTIILPLEPHLHQQSD